MKDFEREIYGKAERRKKTRHIEIQMYYEYILKVPSKLNDDEQWSVLLNKVNKYSLGYWNCDSENSDNINAVMTVQLHTVATHVHTSNANRRERKNTRWQTQISIADC